MFKNIKTEATFNRTEIDNEKSSFCIRRTYSSKFYAG